MLRVSTFLHSRELFTRLMNPGIYIPVTSQYPKKLRPTEMSTVCDQDPPPICPPQACLMDYGPKHIGCWKKVYEEKNKKANMEVLLGIVSIIFALIIVNRNGQVKGYDIPFFSWS